MFPILGCGMYKQPGRAAWTAYGLMSRQILSCSIAIAFFAVPFSDMVCLPQPGGIEHQWDTCVLSPLQTS